MSIPSSIDPGRYAVPLEGCSYPQGATVRIVGIAPGTEYVPRCTQEEFPEWQQLLGAVGTLMPVIDSLIPGQNGPHGPLDTADAHYQGALWLSAEYRYLGERLPGGQWCINLLVTDQLELVTLDTARSTQRFYSILVEERQGEPVAFPLWRETLGGPWSHFQTGTGGVLRFVPPLLMDRTPPNEEERVSVEGQARMFLLRSYPEARQYLLPYDGGGAESPSS